MANFRAEAFSFENVNEASETLNLDFRLRGPRHVGCGEMREHTFELEVL